MILRYITFLILIDIIGHILAIILFPLMYLLRKYKDKYKLIWWFFNDAVGDYGDPYFQSKFKRGNSKWQMFLLSYHWCAFRNHLQNLYNSIRIEGDQEVLILRSNHENVRSRTAGTMWRTVKYCDKNNIFKDKYGAYIDYKNSILGSQYYVFTIKNKKYFRYSKTYIRPISLIKKILIFECKFGFQDHNWAFQFHVNFRKLDTKAIIDYGNYKIHKEIN